MASKSKELSSIIRGRRNEKKNRAERQRSIEELFDSNWEELVIRFDRRTGRYVVRTADACLKVC